jgi:glutamate dehydrogenase (NAD(P)+)
VKIIGISDHTACYHDPTGIDIQAVERHVAKDGFLRGFSTELAFDPKGLLVRPCDILVPAAIERVIDAKVASALNAVFLQKARTDLRHRMLTRCSIGGETRSSSYRIFFAIRAA